MCGPGSVVAENPRPVSAATMSPWPSFYKDVGVQTSHRPLSLETFYFSRWHSASQGRWAAETGCVPGEKATQPWRKGHSATGHDLHPPLAFPLSRLASCLALGTPEMP